MQILPATSFSVSLASFVSLAFGVSVSSDPHAANINANAAAVNNIPLLHIKFSPPN